MSQSCALTRKVPIESDLSLQAGDLIGWTALHHAVAQGDIACTKLLLTRASNVRPHAFTLQIIFFCPADCHSSHAYRLARVPNARMSDSRTCRKIWSVSAIDVWRTLSRTLVRINLQNMVRFT